MGPKLLPLAIGPGDAKPHKIWADAERLGKPVTWMKRSEITTGFIDGALPFIDRAAREKKPFYINLRPEVVMNLTKKAVAWHKSMPPDNGPKQVAAIRPA